MILVADVGGTNSRLALATESGLLSGSVRRFKNTDHASFYDTIETYLAAEAHEAIRQCCVAMAGPVSAQMGRLTNLDWEITGAGLQAATGAEASFLMNDLTALGYCISGLPDGGTSPLCGDRDHAFGNGQSLVVGIGTGFNTCPVLTRPNGAICLEAEAGHVSLPASVARALERRIGAAAAGISSVEECFSGRGMARVFAQATGRAGESAADVVAAHLAGSDLTASAFVLWYAELIARLCQELVLQYMPLDGVYLAGSVARGVLSAGVQREFSTTFKGFRTFDAQLENVPVSIIEDDAAALIGCVEAAKAL